MVAKPEAKTTIVPEKGKAHPKTLLQRKDRRKIPVGQKGIQRWGAGFPWNHVGEQ